MAGVDILLDAINDMQAVTNFEKCVIITLKFFSVNRLLIGIELADLMNQLAVIPHVFTIFTIPGNWRNDLTTTQLPNLSMLYCARYDIQCNEQRFVSLIVQADRILNVSLSRESSK